MSKKFLNKLLPGSIVRYNRRVMSLNRDDITYLYENPKGCSPIKLEDGVLGIIGFEYQPVGQYTRSLKTGDVEVHFRDEIEVYIENEHKEIKLTNIKYVHELQLAVMSMLDVELKLQLCEAE